MVDLSEEYVCAICGYTSTVRAEVVEFKDPVKLPKVLDRARSRGRSIKADDVRYVCLKCSVEMYGEETKQPRSMKVTCLKCGEVVEVWL